MELAEETDLLQPKPLSEQKETGIGFGKDRELTCCGFLPLLDEQASQNLPKHKYSGSDEGILFTYCWEPLATKLVSFLPDWVAPNTITLLGFLHTVLPFFLLFTIADFDLLGDVPNWFFFVQAYCLFAYRMLDEMDGKQARQTGNSSPLGLLFDHGCDAFATVLQALISLRCMQVGNNLFAYAVIVTLMASFYYATLEQYYVGTMRLPMINAVSEGTVIGTGVYIFTGIYGNAIWVTPCLDITWVGIAGVSQMTLGQVVILCLLLIPLAMIVCK